MTYQPVCDVVQNYLDQCDHDFEDTPEKCPFCGGVNTQFASEDLLHEVETHFCWNCEVAFEIKDEIPF